jgi:Na+/proline symporter
MNWNILNLIVFLFYMGILLLIGWIVERTVSKTATGFLLAERKATLPWIVMSVFATGVGSLAYIATVGIISQGGVIDLWFELFWVLGLPLMTLLFARKLRMSGIITFWDSISFRYGSRVALVVALILMFIIPFDFAQMVKGGGLTFSDMFPVLEQVKWIDPVVLGAILAVVVIGIYLAMGGFKSCLVTDMFQGILTWLAMIVPTLAIFWLMGEGSLAAGWQQIVSFFTQNNMSEYMAFNKVVGPTAPLDKYTYSYTSAMLVMEVLMIMLPSMFYGSRYMAAKDERVARQGPILSLIFAFIPYGLFINVTGLSFLAYRNMYAAEIPLGDPLFTGVLEHLAATGAIPMFISSLLLISLLAAVMGTLDSRFLMRMSDYSRTVYQQWINPKANNKQFIRASRLILVLLVLIALVSGFRMPDSIWFLQISVTAIQGPLMLVLIMGAFWSKRATKKGAFAGCLISSSLAILLEVFLTGFQGQYPQLILEPLARVWPSWLHHQFITYPLGVGVFMLVNHTQAPERPEHMERFFSAKITKDYVKKYGFDKPYVIADRTARQNIVNFELKKYGKETRIYGEPARLKKLAEGAGGKYYPEYRRYESWKEVFPERLRGIYKDGLDIAMERDSKHIGEHERKTAKVVGGIGMACSISAFFAMFWFFPVYWKTSVLFYCVGSALMIISLCIFYEDYRWAVRTVDRIEKICGVGKKEASG